ncbi:hypothetical protein AAHA92_08345 [Salvia divinorum]|uniref:Uncharacterized protein n=1 Tax=Salvia divinorum TaxID=28513 RepID=A0ABD1HMX7_SALDI
MEPFSSSSPTKKLLITDLKPKSVPSSASSSSATSTPPAPEKRTRDQPNMSDCHCCGRRINQSNPKDRLQPIDSVWRIVLLCRKCSRGVSSGHTCPYCFQATGNSGDLCTCRACQRKIHNDCVRDYGKCTPWCYLGAGFEGFRVCVDCWVPELLKNSFQVLGGGDIGGLKEKGEGKDMLENSEQNGKCGVETNIEKVVKAKDQVTRGNGTIDEDGLVDGASNLLVKNYRGSLKAGSSNCSGETEADDAELSIQLHRVMNSSPRILRGMPLGSSNDVDASNTRNWKGLSYKRSGLGKRGTGDQKLDSCADSAVNDSSIGLTGLRLGLIRYRRDKKRRIWSIDNENTEISESTSSQQPALNNLHSDEAGVACLDDAGIECSDEAGVGCSLMSGADTSEYPSCDNIGRTNSCADEGRIGKELITYKRTRVGKKVFQMKGLIDVSGNSSPCGNCGLTFEAACCQYDSAILNTSSLVKIKTEEFLPSGTYDTEQDRYHLKYVKRIPGTKVDSSFLRYGLRLIFHLTPLPLICLSEQEDLMTPILVAFFQWIGGNGKYGLDILKQPSSLSLSHLVMAFPNHMEITIPRENTELNHGNIRVVPEIEAIDSSLIAQWLQAAVLGANDGFISVASLMMGAGVVEAGVRALILTFLAGLFASACSMAIGELVHASSQLEVAIAQMKREGSANPSQSAVEAVRAQMRRQGSAYPYPFRPALEATLAFSLGAFAPILAATYVTEYTVRLAVVIAASTTGALMAIGGLGAALGRSRVVSSCVRVLVGGWMAMAITACFTKLLTVSGVEM